MAWLPPIALSWRMAFEFIENNPHTIIKRPWNGSPFHGFLSVREAMTDDRYVKKASPVLSKIIKSAQIKAITMNYLASSVIYKWTCFFYDIYIAFAKS